MAVILESESIWLPVEPCCLRHFAGSYCTVQLVYQCFALRANVLNVLIKFRLILLYSTFLGFCSLYFCPEFDLAKAEYEK